MTSKILYKSSVGKDLKKVGAKDRVRILSQIRAILVEKPRSGEPLHGDFEGLFKLRVGNYRVIYALSGTDVIILRIRNRAKAYE